MFEWQNQMKDQSIKCTKYQECKYKCLVTFIIFSLMKTWCFDFSLLVLRTRSASFLDHSFTLHTEIEYSGESSHKNLLKLIF